jgi:hypothetical protein
MLSFQDSTRNEIFTSCTACIPNKQATKNQLHRKVVGQQEDQNIRELEDFVKHFEMQQFYTSTRTALVRTLWTLTRKLRSWMLLLALVALAS